MLYNQAQRHGHLGRDDVLEHAGTGKRLESHRMFDGLPHLGTELVAIEAFFDGVIRASSSSSLRFWRSPEIEPR